MNKKHRGHDPETQTRTVVVEDGVRLESESFAQGEAPITSDILIENEPVVQVFQSTDLREQAFWLISILMAAAVVFSFAVIFLAGFGLYGFELEESTLNWIVGSIIGEIVVIGGIVYKELFS